MSKPPGRPKSDDPKRALTIRVRSSIMDGFADANAARAAIEALVEARYSPGLRSELARTLGEAPAGKAASTLGPALREALGMAPPAVRPLPNVGRFWPSGALIEPHHTEDPAPKLTLGDHVTFGYQRPKYGERSKKPKTGKKG